MEEDLFAFAGCRTIGVWNSFTKTDCLLEIEDDISAVLFHENLLIGMSRYMHIYDYPSMKSVHVERIHERGTTSAFMMNNLLYTASEDRKIKGWDLRSKREVWSLDTKRPIYSMASVDGEIFFSDNFGYLYKVGSSSWKQISNCSLFLCPHNGGLLGYDRRGRVHWIDSRTMGFSTKTSAGKGYGIGCVADKTIGIGSSFGVEMLSEEKETFVSLGCVESNGGWVWDMDFSSSGDTLFFVSSGGSLQSASFSDGSLQASTWLLLDRPLKALSRKK
ncbi:hypothetical protein NEFER03_1378 [Nematocida sp. LUAm3]|nr:hypothetical protein NEFER03_1378 [Nematocida sp. LUAm3]KAI5174792.1 hypothetical protein NEFER02_0902 [Nematocida sp. LUAm2]KAI5177797.1 hypothetical protein NEFER01_0999 [Nematocida sp. LUAm1]